MPLLHKSRAVFALLLRTRAAYLGNIKPTRKHTNTMFAQLANRIKDFRAHRRTVSLLSQMEDRQLWDIGLIRGDIDSVVRRGRIQH